MVTATEGATSFDIGVLPGKEGTLITSAPIKDKACLPSEVDCVIFHAPCPDGFAAAFVAYLALGDKCEYIGCSHSRKKIPEGIDGKNVAILDFSFDEKTTNEILQRTKSLVILDHHASAQAVLQGLPEENKVFEMNQSGVT
jgi:hypothetical protein